MGTGIEDHIKRHRERIRSSGFSVAEGVSDAALMDRIRKELQPYLQESPTGRNDFEGFQTQRLYALLMKSEAAAALVGNLP